MELATIEVPAAVARKEYLAYRDALRTERDAERRREDEQLMRAYREAAKGARLIRLPAALAAGGVVEREITRTWWNGRERRNVSETFTVPLPAIAVARADVQKVWCDGIGRRGECTLEYTEGRSYDHEVNKRWSIPAGTFPAHESLRTAKHVAMAPSIPPALRPAHHLRNYVLLWEAEWARVPEPPGDPALLKHIGGDLYAVLAVWDLSPLEQAVLAGTRA